MFCLRARCFSRFSGIIGKILLVLGMLCGVWLSSVWVIVCIIYDLIFVI